MKNKNIIFATIIFLWAAASGSGLAQNFDPDAYRQFLEQNQDLTGAALQEMHPAGIFSDKVSPLPGNILYLDSISIKYKLTTYEKSLLSRHGFMVTERPLLNMGGYPLQDTFVDHFMDIWLRDLPVFISTDAILHAFHYHYDVLLQNIEKGVLSGQITTLLADLHGTLPNLAADYADKPELIPMLRDVDLYLTVPLRLLGETVVPFYQENTAAVTALLALIDGEQMGSYPLFSENCREIDFSQFRPRGHYTEDETLRKYFRTMIWLGRIEWYLIAPDAETLNCPKPTPADIQRQGIGARLLMELIGKAAVEERYQQIEDVISFLVGEQDNVTPPQLINLTAELGLSAVDLLDSLTWRSFQDTLRTRPYAFQRIQSQILAHDLLMNESAQPAAAMMLFGQRFIIDSYISGNVVYDKIMYKNTFPCRLFPSTQDILFALGNDASAQLIKEEVDSYHYASNLSALRYLTDSYDTDFWESSVYNLWLNTIRGLNPPQDRDNLPGFMRTAAWWQQKMNTQLSSWTELRHDHLLYAKPSYTTGLGCSYPYAYVEPIPGFFDNLSRMGEVGAARFNVAPFTDEKLKSKIVTYFGLVKQVADTLGGIARKELTGAPLSDPEKKFLINLLVRDEYGSMDGWYMALMLGQDMIPLATSTDQFLDYLVADYHTIPTDCNGTVMGWVDHVGTGAVNLAVVTAQSNEQTIAFAGPVMSYHEFRSTNFQRLTDEEWTADYLALSSRPDWVNIYLADRDGNSKGSGSTLITAVDKPGGAGPSIPQTVLLMGNYPNPFNSSTVIAYTIPSGPLQMTTLEIYDITGRIVRRLVSRDLPSGHYLTRWDGTDDQGVAVASGIYISRLRVGNEQVSGKMLLAR